MIMIVLAGKPGAYPLSTGTVLVQSSGLVYSYDEKTAAELMALGFEPREYDAETKALVDAAAAEAAPGEPATEETEEAEAVVAVTVVPLDPTAENPTEEEGESEEADSAETAPEEPVNESAPAPARRRRSTRGK